MKKVWKFTTDVVSQTLYVDYGDGTSDVMALFSHEAFQVLSAVWLKVGWSLKYSYNFSWLGRPIIQLPEDLMMIQEVIYRIKPDVLIETGVAHGGTSVYYATLFEALGNGRVISIDIEIRPHNRAALEAHPLKKRITLIEGSSAASGTLEQVHTLLRRDEIVMVVLDSDHSKAHVLSELNAYAPLVTVGSYIVATDGNMGELSDVPGAGRAWLSDNPKVAIHEFLSAHPEFEVDAGPTRLGITYWPDAYLRRRA